MKIDIFTHIGTEKYLEAVFKKVPARGGGGFRGMGIETKLRAMERTPDVLEVVTSLLPPIPPIEVPVSGAVVFVLDIERSERF